jgi:hypothetical protein
VHRARPSRLGKDGGGQLADEPGRDEPGRDEPGDDEPGDDEPGGEGVRRAPPVRQGDG